MTQRSRSPRPKREASRRRREYSPRVHDRHAEPRPEPVCTCEYLPGFGVDSAGCEMHGDVS